MATTICLDFQLFPDNTPMPVPFTLAGFEFAKVSVGMDLFVNESGGGKGLQFPDQGVKIKLPAPSARIGLTIGQFSGTINILLADSTGATVGTGLVNSPGLYTIRNFTLRKKAALVVLTGGGNEGILAKICARI